MNILRYPYTLVFLVLSLGVTLEALAGAPENNKLFDRLVKEGVALKDGMVVRLPPPTFADEAAPAEQRELVTTIAGRYGWAAFVRKSAVAPFVLKQIYLKDQQGDRVGHAIDLWFVAYGNLADFQNEDLGKRFFGQEQDPEKDQDVSSRELNDTELSQAGLRNIARDRERYALTEMSLMNRVHVRVVGHAEQTQNDNSLLLAWEVDPSFEEQPDLAGRWYPLETTDLGERRKGEAKPYQGYGGYLKITPLAEPAGALLFETHVVFHEPKDWFRGSNFLRSKTPLIVRENVDKLRRKLAKIHRERS